MRFVTKKGWLTLYALVCGYQEYFEKNRICLRLWREAWSSGCCFHVRAYNFNNGKRLFWESFPKLTTARKRFVLAKKELFGVCIL